MCRIAYASPALRNALEINCWSIAKSVKILGLGLNVNWKAGERSGRSRFPLCPTGGEAGSHPQADS